MQKRNVGGRPPKEIATKLSKSINIKFSEQDFCNLVECAKAANVTPTAYARSMVLSGRVVAPYTAEELKLMRALAGEANNLNQPTLWSESNRVYSNCRATRRKTSVAKLDS